MYSSQVVEKTKESSALASSGSAEERRDQEMAFAFACEQARDKFLCADRLESLLSACAWYQTTCNKCCIVASQHCRYEPSDKFDGDVLLIRARQGAVRGDDIDDDYGLSSVRYVQGVPR